MILIELNFSNVLKIKKTLMNYKMRKKKQIIEECKNISDKEVAQFFQEKETKEMY